MNTRRGLALLVIVLVVVAIALGVGVVYYATKSTPQSGTAQTYTNESNWKVYHNDPWGITLKYPPYLTLYEPPELGEYHGGPRLLVTSTSSINSSLGFMAGCFESLLIDRPTLYGSIESTSPTSISGAPVELFHLVGKNGDRYFFVELRKQFISTSTVTGSGLDCLFNIIGGNISEYAFTSILNSVQFSSSSPDSFLKNLFTMYSNPPDLYQ